MKTVKVGDRFTVRGHTCTMTGQKDIRVFRCLGKTKVELLEPSEAQIDGDAAFRNGTWKKTAVSDVEEAWYTQRGLKVVA